MNGRNCFFLLFSLFVVLDLTHSSRVNVCSPQCFIKDICEICDFQNNKKSTSFKNLPWISGDIDWMEIGAAFLAAGKLSGEATILWGRFFLLLMKPLLYCILVTIEALMPHFQQMLYISWEYWNSRSTKVKFQFLGLFGLFLFIYKCGFFGKAISKYRKCKLFIRNRYRSFWTTVNAKSRTAAMLLPHIHFIGLFLVAIYFFRPLLQPIADDGTLLLFLSLGLPLFRSYRLLLEQDNTSKEWSTGMELQLMYWVLWGIYYVVTSLVSFVVPNIFLVYFSIPPIYTLFFVMWLQTPWTDGKSVAYNACAPYIHPYVNKVPQTKENQGNVILRALVAISILPPNFSNYLEDILQQGPALIAVLFYFTPGFITQRACCFVGMAIPAYLCIGAMSFEKIDRYRWWLTYFIVLALFEKIHEALSQILGWIPLWYHLKLTLILWLQFPYFRGAQTLFDGFVRNVMIQRIQQV